MPPIYIAPYVERAKARADLAAAFSLVTDTITLLAMRERRVERLLEALRRERDGLASDKRGADEAERLLARAGDRYKATHQSARQWRPPLAGTPHSATSGDRAA